MWRIHDASGEARQAHARAQACHTLDVDLFARVLCAVRAGDRHAQFCELLLD